MTQFHGLDPQEFPSVNSESAKKTSEITEDYNCIAWAAGDSEKWWWPLYPNYWPVSVERDLTIEAFKKAYATLGYVDCRNIDLEEGFEKVAIYLKKGIPQHAARQLKSGKWTSKLGANIDVEH